ncbi:hypothetical protein U1299_06945 [Enterococcus cecorum]|uniref:Uncharacterized protein n=1 Tax=Enterococcus cecorum TaxID=44008 RepID=A0AAW9JW29_9ENTE|nr:hypothetical protein [Enterococcus cecorum]MDZ5504371.1 hypothetical protein [Enterococcus cecorum]MDZ5531778.1 hypothetical protein [Enterococcus cecorum]MDZ5545304.1 hypothetical protein [Enterococcus cecorum]MDZ5550118.1 hypothetical protein [Enterococcus cecorum]MDZ5552154.1 hypothetical protein [Enterococcus cecorum]
MNDQQLIKKVNEVAENQHQQQGYIAPVDVLMEIGVLTKQNYEAWRFGKVSYLEKACTCNLNKLTKILKQIYKYAQKNALKPSVSQYRLWGKKGKELRFSKSGRPEVERKYATHFVDSKKIAELKAKKC